MEERNHVLSKNLDLMYGAQIIALICVVLLLIPFINIFALIMAVIAAVMSVVALVRLRNLHRDYTNAIAVMLLAVFLKLFAQGDGVFSAVMGMGSSIASLFQTYFIIRATNSLLGEIGCEEVIAVGDTAWRLTLVSCVISIVCDALGLVFLPLILVGLIIALVISIVSLVYFLKYLKRSSEAFRDAASPALAE